MIAMNMLAAVTLAVTNHVGTVARGEYVRSSSSHLFLRTAAGVEFSVPYSSLRQAERDRVQLAVGAWRPPTVYRDLVDFHKAELKRIDLLEENGTLTAEEAAKRREGERKSFVGVRNRLISEGRLPKALADREP